MIEEFFYCDRCGEEIDADNSLDIPQVMLENWMDERNREHFDVCGGCYGKIRGLLRGESA